MIDLFAEAMVGFRQLLDEAKASGDPEPTAMTLATLGDGGRVAARTVLLKGFDERGFVFYTNCDSRKGNEIREHAQCALLFHWRHIRHGVQVRIEGPARQVDDAEADRYFASRPRMSQIGAWASDQSRTLPSREAFEARIAEAESRFEGQPIPRPPHWSGFRVEPDAIELWYGAEFRLHERYLYERREDGQWSKRMLFP
ncbi:pyridoxamine 5'-phosphate oxidase [Pseudomarimonas salicorniae]|uniref:Pyridoxine/pyridoxamine 5'-phosphate oxidase n=1 Tax=Pseudomarimonas salicorniae TaxID=2933270 RepID=A0ABT0GLV4_9GAMM|nr:pyridoxamine 5'-phosphate oxidase [Lysobacter sp. CAU 1642]MCK7595017.1 pyridoxamine 5'-phosphate oxidase [Lysobacter sp. CAU 1642]